MRLQGRLFDGQSSTSHKAVLVVDEAGLVSSEPGILTITPFKDIQISSRLANTPRTLTFPGGEIFETVAHDRLDSFIKQQGGKVRLAGLRAQAAKFRHPDADRVVALRLRVVEGLQGLARLAWHEGSRSGVLGFIGQALYET